jgi:hypothetical protein
MILFHCCNIAGTEGLLDSGRRKEKYKKSSTIATKKKLNA